MRYGHGIMALMCGTWLAGCAQSPAAVENRGEVFFGDPQTAALYRQVHQPARATFGLSHFQDESRPAAKKSVKAKEAVAEEEPVVSEAEKRDTVQHVASERVRVNELQPPPEKMAPEKMTKAEPFSKPQPFTSPAAQTQVAEAPQPLHTAMTLEARKSAAADASGMITHVVQPGETIFRISKQYNVPVQDIVRVNNIQDVSGVKVGQALKIPAQQESSAQMIKAAAPQTEVASAPDRGKEEVQRAEASGFIWPVEGKVIAEFGRQSGGLYNDGINIEAPAGAPVKAAADGTVAYAGNELQGYGNLVIVRHKNGWLTAYAHNEKLLVARGEAVTQGQVIAHVGATGKVDKPQLHFGVRQGKEARDPLQVLKSGGRMNVASVQ